MRGGRSPVSSSSISKMLSKFDRPGSFKLSKVCARESSPFTSGVGHLQAWKSTINCRFKSHFHSKWAHSSLAACAVLRVTKLPAGQSIISEVPTSKFLLNEWCLLSCHSLCHLQAYTWCASYSPLQSSYMLTALWRQLASSPITCIHKCTSYLVNCCCSRHIWLCIPRSMIPRQDRTDPHPFQLLCFYMDSQLLAESFKSAQLFCQTKSYVMINL